MPQDSPKTVKSLFIQRLTMTDKPKQSKSSGANLMQVNTEYAGQRLDNFLLREFKQLPRSLMYRLVRSGQVRINGSRCKPMQKLKEGDEIRLPPKLVEEKKAYAASEAENGQVQLPPKMGERLNRRVLFEDERLLIIDKPAGMAVHGGSGISLGIIEALRLIRPDLPYLELVHRLDRSTSGCLMLAKKRSALRELHRQIRENEVGKQYLALLKGHWSQRARVDLPLNVEHRRNKERHVVVSDDGKKAVSHFNLEQHYVGLKNKDLKLSLMKVDLETGRTHQIRAHALAKGHPLAGDDRYGDALFNQEMTKLSLKRLFLHAHYLSFVHPASGEDIAVSAPLPEELSKVLDKLKAV